MRNIYEMDIPLPKFLVGDMVTVMPRQPGDEYKKPNFVDEMLRYVGHSFEVISGNVSIHYNDAYVYTLQLKDHSSGYFLWHEDWLGFGSVEDMRFRIEDEDLLI